jgi:UDP-N-acetylmuramoyl-tripeptide--D-alanyl-D-alanine ligase
MSQTIEILLLIATLSGAGLSTWKWLRVAQREHYESGRVTKIALIWVRARPLNVLLVFITIASTVIAFYYPISAILAVAFAAIFPWRLSTFPKATRLVFTGRVKRLLSVVTVIEVLLFSVAWWTLPATLALIVLMIAPTIDLSLALTRPIETTLAKRYLTTAKKRLAEVAPTVVAITGSYGKTTTKQYVNRVVSGSMRTLASPASFNNLLGLSKAVNDGLRPGVEVFVAEMGTYGPGEIRRLCQLFAPSIGAITTIGEAHLERMGSRAEIVRAKSEILEGVHTAVLNVDVPELAEIADRLRNSKTVLRCSAVSVEGSDVAVIEEGDQWRIFFEGTWAGDISAPVAGHRINLAVACAIARAVGVSIPRIVTALDGGLAQPSHRAEVVRSQDGTVVIDDTFNSNPEGAEAAIRSARSLVGASSTIWTVSPGMIELGDMQSERNREFAKIATAEPFMRLIVVGFTNRRDLLAGANDPARVLTARDRISAQRLLQDRVRTGDVLLYENDLPSHYP